MSILARAFVVFVVTLAALVWPAHTAPEPFRLDRLGIVRFSDIGGGQVRRETGALLVDGDVQWRVAEDVPRPNNLDDRVVGRLLVPRHAWAAYHALGAAALQNFELQEGAVVIFVGDEEFMAVGVNPFAYTAIGNLVNVSTRARLTGPGDQVIAGFVIEERARTVLVRVVGPTLASHGVGDAVSDSFLRIKHGDTQLYANNDWAALANAGDVRAAAARVGAFPLNEDSLDAAQLVVLPPGAYTVWGEVPPDTGGGSVLIEVYAVPEEW